MSLYWLPKHPDFRSALKACDAIQDPAERFDQIRALSAFDLDLIQTAALYKRLKVYSKPPEKSRALAPVKLALLSASTMDQVIPALHIAALRRGIWLDLYLPPYNLFRQEMLDPSSSLHRFRPEVVLFALNAQSISPELSPTAEATEADCWVESQFSEYESLWKLASERWNATVIQQTFVIPPESVFGGFDAAQRTTARSLLEALNGGLARAAEEKKIVLFDLEKLAGQVGKDEWCQLPLWFHGKQDISPAHAPLYGDHVGRLLAALRGRSAKCLVLDLDNTLWGGVIGDDGLEGIEIGEGSGRGESFLHFQKYLRRLRQRGILLAACSKNDPANALLPFRNHPDMILHRDDFAAFVANWKDKASNIRALAEELKLGLDSLLFVDDNPVERKLIRDFLPAVIVPELGEDPAYYAKTLSDSGYLEAVALTQDDAARAAQYRDNAARQERQKAAPDLDSFLKGLGMTMQLSPFDSTGRARIAQLINKSNQFNLTTRRYTETQVKALEQDAIHTTLQIRLQDSCGDNGMISVVIARPMDEAPTTLLIDTWLMSCRVLGRGVEQEVLNQLVELARRRGMHRLRGQYIPTEKNSMVRDHYRTLGFKPALSNEVSGSTSWELDLDRFAPKPTHIRATYQERVS